MAPLSLSAVLVVVAALIPLTTRWDDRVERRSVQFGYVAGALLVSAATVVRGVTGELLSGLWILPLAVALQAITTRRFAISEREARDLMERQTEIATHLARSEERARLALESGQMAWYEYRPRTGELTCTPELVAMIAGADATLGQAPVTEESAIRELIASATRAGSRIAEVEWGGERGPTRWLEATAHQRDDAADPIVVGVVKDITVRKEAEATELARILTDPLTGLANRAALLAALEAELAAGEPFALLVMDIDRFKELNESIGHPFADRVLVALARRLTASLRPDDMLARLGGDEFAVIVRPPAAGEPVARFTLAEIARPLELEGVTVRVTASIGLVEAPLDGGDGVTLLRRADAAMYRAKERRRGTWSRPDADGEAQATRRLALARADPEARPVLHP